MCQRRALRGLNLDQAKHLTKNNSLFAIDMLRRRKRMLISVFANIQKLTDMNHIIINISEAEKRLKELEEEKRKLDAELKAAQDKISKTEHTAQALQVQLRVSFTLE